MEQGYSTPSPQRDYDDFGGGYNDDFQVNQRTFIKAPQGSGSRKGTKVRLRTNINQIRAKKYASAYSPKKNQSSEVSLRPLQGKKPQWNDNTQTIGFFDPSVAKKSLIRHNTEADGDAPRGAAPLTEQEQRIYEPLKRSIPDRAQDIRSRAARALQEKMEKDRRVYESYHTLGQIQELIDKENARKNAKLLTNKNKELTQLRWMIDQEQKRKGDQDKVFKDKYEKLKEQKQINMDLQQKMLEIKSKKLQKIKQQSEEHEADLDKPHVFKEGARSDERGDMASKNQPPAEYIEGMIWERDPRMTREALAQQQAQPSAVAQTRQQGLSAVNVPEKETDDNDKKNLRLAQKKQKQFNDQVQTQLADIQREQVNSAQRQREVQELLETHKEQLRRDKEMENYHYEQIEKKINKIKGVAEPLEERLTHQQDKDQYQGNILAKATGKMIQTYNDKVTDLLIDDLLYETVALLQQMEEEQTQETKKMKRQSVVGDYIEEFRNLAAEQEDIIARSKRQFKALEFFDGPKQAQRKYIQDATFAHSVGLEMGLAVMLKIIEKRNRFSETLNKKTYYSKRNLESFKIITEELIDDIIEDLAHNLDKANDEYAEVLFKNEFS